MNAETGKSSKGEDFGAELELDATFFAGYAIFHKILKYVRKWEKKVQKNSKAYVRRLSFRVSENRNVKSGEIEASLFIGIVLSEN